MFFFFDQCCTSDRDPCLNLTISCVLVGDSELISVPVDR